MWTDGQTDRKGDSFVCRGINTKWKYLPSKIFQQEAQRATYRAPEYNMPPFWGIGQDSHFCLLIGEKYKLSRGHWDLASCQFSLNSVQQFHGRSQKCLSQTEARATILFFRSAHKNTNLVKDVEIFLPVKFRWILINYFQRRSRKMSQPISGQGGHLVFRSEQKTQTL